MKDFLREIFAISLTTYSFMYASILFIPIRKQLTIHLFSSLQPRLHIYKERERSQLPRYQYLVLVNGMFLSKTSLLFLVCVLALIVTDGECRRRRRPGHFPQRTHRHRRSTTTEMELTSTLSSTSSLNEQDNSTLIEVDHLLNVTFPTELSSLNYTPEENLFNVTEPTDIVSFNSTTIDEISSPTEENLNNTLDQSFN